LQPQGLEALIEGFLELPDLIVDNPQVGMRHVVSRVCLYPQVVSLDRLVQFPRHPTVIPRSDTEPFPFANPLAKLERFRQILVEQLVLIEVAVFRCQCHVRHSEIGVQFDGALEERDLLELRYLPLSFKSRVISLERFQRRGGSLSNRRIEFFNGR
jgi:hypothetical protein